MNDGEFYQLEENWPQPPDDSVTLEQPLPEATGEKRKKKASSSKVRKKMSESLAGVTAAAVAVVMVATAIPSLKDIADDISPILPDFDNYSEVCVVCGQPECHYFGNGYPGLVLELDSEPDHVSENDYLHMPGFAESDYQFDRIDIPALVTEKMERIVMRLNSHFAGYLAMIAENESVFQYHAGAYYGEELAYSGIWFYGYDEKDHNQTLYFHAVIVHDPSGSPERLTMEKLTNKHEMPENLPTDLQYYSRDIPAIANTRLQICTNVDKELVDPVFQQINVQVIDSLKAMNLGTTMVLTESEDCFRDYYDVHYSSMRHTHGFNIDGQNQYRTLKFALNGKHYGLETSAGSMEVIFYAAGWQSLVDRWRDLNMWAPESGHEVCYEIVELNTLTVNSIRYTCYMAYSTKPIDDVNNYPWVWYYFVPQQEETIAIKYHRSMSPEELMKTLEQGSSDDDSYMDILNQITLR